MVESRLERKWSLSRVHTLKLYATEHCLSTRYDLWHKIYSNGSHTQSLPSWCLQPSGGWDGINISQINKYI